jgi:hypothetical protein
MPTLPHEMAPQCHQPSPPHVIPSQNAFQALVHAPRYGNNQSFDGGEENDNAYSISIAESTRDNYVFKENTLPYLVDHNDTKHIITYQMIDRLIQHLNNTKESPIQFQQQVAMKLDTIMAGTM